MGRLWKTKTSASEKRGVCGIVVIGYAGAGVWKEVKPDSDCVELTVRLSEGRLNCEPRERSFHEFLGVEVDQRYALKTTAE
jgi:hypothetical protein